MIVASALLALAPTPDAMVTPPAAATEEMAFGVATPKFPNAAVTLVKTYLACINGNIPKEISARPSEDFERGIEACRPARAEAEMEALALKTSEWPRAGSRERAAAVSALFDGLDDGQRSMARAIEAQIAQLNSPIPTQSEDDAEHH